MSKRIKDWRKQKWAAMALAIALLFVLAGLAKHLSDFGNRPESRQRLAITSDDPIQTHVASETVSDEHYRALVVGTWEDDFQGHRMLTIRNDGTATMVVELEGLAAMLYAKRMTFEEEWKIEAGQLRLKAVGGEPESRVNLILETMGDVSEQKILQLTEDRLLLLDSDGRTEYDWRRTRLEETPAS